MFPDLECLRCFDAAATHLNFRAAARQVALSPAAFSSRIKRLEEELGAPLFIRTTRKVSLSAAGQALVPQARRAFAELALCRDVVKDGQTRAPFTLQVGTRFELGLSWLTPALGDLARARPERTLNLHFGDSPDLLGRIRDGRLDCAITSARLTSSWIRYALLHEERYAFVAAPRLTRHTPLRGPKDAAAHALIDLSADLPLFRYFVDARPPGEVWGFARKELLGTIAAVRLRVLEGAGLAVLPRYFVDRDLRQKRLVALLPRQEPGRDFFRLVWREGHPREQELSALADELRARPLQ